MDEEMDIDARVAGMTKLADLAIDKIEKLADLHERGILTDEEFSAKKAELLNEI